MPPHVLTQGPLSNFEIPSPHILNTCGKPWEPSMVECSLGEIWKTHSPRCPKNFVINFLCSIFSKGTQSFDFIKSDIIWKLTYEVKYISQINGGLMFSRNLRTRFFKLVGTIWKESIQKKEHNQHSLVFKVLR